MDLVNSISGIDEIYPESDIFNFGLIGDDFHEVIEKYSETFEVDMSVHLWYFHVDYGGHQTSSSNNYCQDLSG